MTVDDEIKEKKTSLRAIDGGQQSSSSLAAAKPMKHNSAEEESKKRPLRGYVRGEALGKGQWGVVYKGRRVSDGALVAIKEVRCPEADAEGINFQVVREIKMLRGVRHAYVVSLLDVLHTGRKTISMVFELMATDLERVLYDDPRGVTLAEAKGYAAMLLEALAFLHAHFALHRDVKPSNLLISTAGVLKLADFGYARFAADANRHMSYACCTLWYRPPELLFGATEYGAAIDAWSAGCVVAEILARKPLFKGTSDIDQLAKIFQLSGTPDDSNWPGVASLRKFIEFAPTSSVLPAYLAAEIQPALDHADAKSDFVDLTTSLLVHDPKRRASCATALNHALFQKVPAPTTRPRKSAAASKKLAPSLSSSVGTAAATTPA